MDDVRIGEGAVVRRAIIDKNVVVAPGVQWAPTLSSMPAISPSRAAASWL